MTDAYELWRGRSRIDGEPIVAIITGLDGSQNSKTGDMAQTWILHQDMTPSQAIRRGKDESVCGNCVHRPIHGNGTCYVQTAWGGPDAIWKKWRAGGYPVVTSKERPRLRSQGHTRVGSYGDPCAVPAAVWRVILPPAGRFTGYTHQWRQWQNRPYSKFLMASCDTEAELAEAEEKGWRGFLVQPINRPIPPELTWCPSDALNPAEKVKCEDCGLCSGTEGKGSKSVGIYFHGASGSVEKHARTYGQKRSRLPLFEKKPPSHDPVVRLPRDTFDELKRQVGRTTKPWLDRVVREALGLSEREGG